MINRITKSITILFFLIFLGISSPAQMTNPEDPGGGPEAGDPPLGGGAPIGESILLLVSLGIAYSGIKMFKKRNEKNNEIQEI